MPIIKKVGIPLAGSIAALMLMEMALRLPLDRLVKDDGVITGLPEGEYEKVAAEGDARLSVYSADSDGLPVLFAHGWGENMFLWGPIAKELVANGFKVFAFDQRGHGNSDKQFSDFSVKAMAGDIKKLIEYFELKDLILVGHSMGGMSTIEFLSSYPDFAKKRLSRGILVATAGWGTAMPASLIAAVSKLLQTGYLDKYLTKTNSGKMIVRSSLGKRASKVQLEFTVEMFSNTDKLVRAKCLQAIKEFNRINELSKINVPTTVVHGDRDMLLPVFMARNTAKALKECDYEELSEIGHMIPIESPEKVVELVQLATR